MHRNIIRIITLMLAITLSATALKAQEQEEQKSPEEMASYFSSWICDKTCQDEETMSSVMNRSEKAVIETVENLEREGKNSALIVTHSGFIRSLIIKLFKLDRSCFLKMFVPNGLGYVITFKNTDPIYYRKLGAKSISFS